jgi:hypothetical protein
MSDDNPCTDCWNSGWCEQTEKRCTCQPPLTEADTLRAENARLRLALQHAEAAMEGMASDQLTAVETANLWNATMKSIRAALEVKP